MPSLALGASFPKTLAPFSYGQLLLNALTVVSCCELLLPYITFCANCLGKLEQGLMGLRHQKKRALSGTMSLRMAWNFCPVLIKVRRQCCRKCTGTEWSKMAETTPFSDPLCFIWVRQPYWRDYFHLFSGVPSSLQCSQCCSACSPSTVRAEIITRLRL